MPQREWSTRRYVMFFHRRGESDAAIARRMGGVNSSFVHQIRAGTKKGTDYRTFLAAQARARTPAPPPPSRAPARPTGVATPPRRRTGTGQPARVREGKQRFTTTQGRAGFVRGSGGERAHLNDLRRAPPGTQVTMRVTFRSVQRYGNRTGLAHQEIEVFGRGGYSAAEVAAAAERMGGLHRWLEAYVNNPEVFPQIAGARGVERVEIEVVGPR
jgi:hypothetical protein